MSQTAVLMEGIRKRLVALGRPVADRFRPGLESELVRSVGKSHGLELPPPLVELYGFANGAGREHGTLHENQLFLGLVFLSVQDAAERYESIKGVFWEPAWWPVLCSFGGPEVAVDCATETAAVEVTDVNNGVAVRFPSLHEYLRFAQAALDTGVWFVEGPHIFYRPAENDALAQKHGGAARDFPPEP